MYYWSKEFSGYIYWHCFGCYWVRGLYSCALPAGSPLNSRHYRGNNHNNNNNSNNNNSNKNNNNNKQRPFAGGPCWVSLPPVTYIDSATPGFLFYQWGVLPGVSSRYVGLFGLPFPPRYVRPRPHPRGSSSMETLCEISKSGQMNEVPKCKRSRRRRRFFSDVE